MTAADITCTATQSGSLFSAFGPSSTIFKGSEIVDAIQTVTVVSATGTAGSAPQKTGAAPPGPLPTGAMVFVGGAAGLFAALIL